MSKIPKTHPKSVQSHKDLILQCLDHKDESICLRASDLLYSVQEELDGDCEEADDPPGQSGRDNLQGRAADQNH
ncbi:Hypothetical predicted protein [Podarcis lilfordi]|uniref:Uncharacterized protein n=1 Tax=Podarcis lilfordi TaxID=74358 RepID=A0AA35PJP5_9SAUR|nr:Hypothetical predicted protein [Podarcis lilfordi]